MPDKENIERLIYIDDLTGLFNRRYLYYQLPKEIEAAREGKYNVWLFMLDVDNFKSINDNYGHLYGDELMKALAGILKESTKADDKKIRYAGDEYAVIITRLEPKDILNIAQRLVTKISMHPFKGKQQGKEIYITVSVGIASFPQNALGAIELIDLADKALYISKEKGKNCVSSVAEITPELFWKKDVLERFPCPAFIEREKELSCLKDALIRIDELRGKILFLNGNMGIGKSRLLSEFNKFAPSQSGICLSVRGEERYLAQAYRPLGKALYKYLATVDKFPPEVFLGMSESESEALVNFMPVLNNFMPPPQIKQAVSHGIDFLDDALIKFLFNLARGNPLCLIFDDFHYIDSQSLNIILRLISENKEFPVLILAAFCNEEIPLAEVEAREFPLAQALKTGAFGGCSQIIALEGLTALGVSAMVSQILSGIPLSADLAGLIYKITKGNPLFVEFLLKYIIEKEYIFYQNGSWKHKEIRESDLPSSLEETIKARIEDLSPEIKEMIAKAAVIGEDFEVGMLQNIDREDRGYILDLIESVRKVGFIRELGSGGGEEYGFIPEQIRKVIFKMIGDSRMKNLYSRVGQMKEDLYKDNLPAVAGELYHHFKKAQDWTRAQQYSKMVKDSANTAFYEQAHGYAQAVLKESQTEKPALPLSKDNAAIALDIIRYIYIVSVNYNLYPPQSKIRTQSVEELYQRLTKILAEVNLLNIACVEQAIIVNNKKLGRESRSFFTEAFISLFKNFNIESISFASQLSLQELSSFIDIINRTQEREEGISEELNSAGVTHIQINEIVYDVSKRKSREKENLGEMMLSDYLMGKLFPGESLAGAPSQGSLRAQGINQVLEKLGEETSKKSGQDKSGAMLEIMTESINRTQSMFADKDSQEWLSYKQGLAKTILAMEPQLRAGIFSNYAQGAKKGSFDLIKELSPEIPDDIAADVVREEYLKKGISLDEIKDLTREFLSGPKKKETLLPLLKKQLKASGATQEECDWIFEDKGWGDFSLEEKVNKVLTLPLDNLIRMLPIIKVKSIVKELVSLGQESNLEAVIEKLVKCLEDGFADSRLVVEYLEDILQLLIVNSPGKLLPKFISRLFKMVSSSPQKLSGVFFSIITAYLDMVIQAFLDTNRLFLIREIIQLYTNSPQVMEGAAKNIERVVDKLTQELIKRIDNNIDWREITETLILLKDQAARPLLEAALFEKGVAEGKYFEAYLRRYTISRILRQIPQAGLLRLLKERLSDPRLYIIKNLIEVIAAMEDEEVVRILDVTINHSDITVRRKAIFALSKIRGKESAKLLGEALRDKSPDLRKEALHILKGRTDNFAQEVLKDSTGSSDLSEDIRQAL